MGGLLDTKEDDVVSRECGPTRREGTGPETDEGRRRAGERDVSCPVPRVEGTTETQVKVREILISDRDLGSQEHPDERNFRLTPTRLAKYGHLGS